MSLREEINSELVGLTVFTGTERTTKELGDKIEETRDSIISIIEKRIDEKIEWFKSEYDGTVDPYIIIPYLEEIKELLR